MVGTPSAHDVQGDLEGGSHALFHVMFTNLLSRYNISSTCRRKPRLTEVSELSMGRPANKLEGGLERRFDWLQILPALPMCHKLTII